MPAIGFGEMEKVRQKGWEGEKEERIVCVSM
jgi:hypothetical protein